MTALAPERLALDDALRDEIAELTATLRGNLEKIVQHGRRADSIVQVTCCCIRAPVPASRRSSI